MLYQLSYLPGNSGIPECSHSKIPSEDRQADSPPGTSVYAGPDISSVFKGAITVYTDASTGTDMVDDTCLYGVNNYVHYWNYGVSPTSLQNEPLLVKFKVSQLPGLAGGRINKAELQLYLLGGNTNPPVAQVISRDWSEGNKNGDYPGLPTARSKPSR